MLICWAAFRFRHSTSIPKYPHIQDWFNLATLIKKQKAVWCHQLYMERWPLEIGLSLNIITKAKKLKTFYISCINWGLRVVQFSEDVEAIWYESKSKVFNQFRFISNFRWLKFHFNDKKSFLIILLSTECGPIDKSWI